MIWRIEIRDKESVFDAAGASILKNIEDLGIRSVKKVNVVYVFFLSGRLTGSQVQRISQELLADPVIQEFSYFSKKQPSVASSKKVAVVEVAYRPGVMDPSEASIRKGIHDLGFHVASVRTAKKYILQGALTQKEIERITNRILLNKLIQYAVKAQGFATAITEKKFSKKKFAANIIPILEASHRQLRHLSCSKHLFLNVPEMIAIQNHFKKLQRNPTDCELETIAQTWSEHCHHKTFRGNIEYVFENKGKQMKHLIKNLLKTTIMQATKEIDAPWCVSVFHDNSGIIAFDSKDHICFKVETHNHPSALEPFGGANTGIGGVIRDAMGTGLGAKPIANTDVFCFAPPDIAFHQLPEGVLHPWRIIKGVVDGVRDYGNKTGIPTLNGAVVFNKRFIGNPLVFCGTVGLIPRNKVIKRARPGDLIVVLGGRTGRDGIHGATFSSGELTQESEKVSSGAVQIGNPIEEKKVLDVIVQARDQGLYTAITDCGAGGFSSAIGEMAAEIGCRVDLDKAPVKYDGLSYDEIWISESQERMILAVPPKNFQKLLHICDHENVQVAALGKFTATNKLELFYGGAKVCDLSMDFLHHGIPQVAKKAFWSHKEPRVESMKFSCPQNLTQKLKDVLSHYNVCSKENIIRRYDHEVQGSSVIKPLVGPNCDGPSDASVIRPKLTSDRGLAIANGINVRFGMIDPYWMAASCIDETIRQIVAVGGKLNHIAILDNFCWGNPDKPDRLGGLVRCAQGCYDTAVGYQTPFISGKDSLYNEYAERGKTHSIPGTLLISAIGMVDDVKKCVSMDFKKEGHLIYVLGETFEEMGGSVYGETHNRLGTRVPRVNTVQGRKNFLALEKAIAHQWVYAAHDCSEGGLAVALAEMAFAGNLGLTVSLKKVPFQGRKRNDVILFSESNSRFVVEVSPRHQREFENLFQETTMSLIGQVKSEKDFLIYGLNDQKCIQADIRDLKESWQKTLRW